MHATFNARTVAQTIRDELERGDSGFALRMLVVAVRDLRKVIAAGHPETFLIEPEPTGSVGWDTLLAAQTGRELRLVDLERPAWTRPEALPTWWFVNLPSAILVPRIMQRTSVDLSRLGIWLDDKSFTTA